MTVKCPDCFLPMEFDGRVWYHTSNGSVVCPSYPTAPLYRDEYGNDLRASNTDDLLAGSIQHALCRVCGEWYHWDDAHLLGQQCFPPVRRLRLPTREVTP